MDKLQRPTVQITYTRTEDHSGRWGFNPDMFDLTTTEGRRKAARRVFDAWDGDWYVMGHHNQVKMDAITINGEVFKRADF